MAIRKNHIIYIVTIALVLAVVGIYVSLNKSTSPTISLTSSDAVGQYAYNKNDGQYRGKIAGQKLCKTGPQLQCYEIEGELGIYEVNIDDVIVKNNLR